MPATLDEMDSVLAFAIADVCPSAGRPQLATQIKARAVLTRTEAATVDER
jgi:hypothetical protein